jgi:hypothetical protein
MPGQYRDSSIVGISVIAGSERPPSASPMVGQLISAGRGPGSAGGLGGFGRQLPARVRFANPARAATSIPKVANIFRRAS